MNAISSGGEDRKIRNCGLCNKQYRYNRGIGATLAYCPSCMTMRARRATKVKFVEYLGGKCVRCGYNKCMDALEFHHIDPSTKKFSISGSHTRRWSIAKAELDKCEILCANCHREIAAEMWIQKHMHDNL